MAERPPKQITRQERLAMAERYRNRVYGRRLTYMMPDNQYWGLWHWVHDWIKALSQ